MCIQEITATTLVKKYASIESWFGCRYSFNLYRGCLHNCAYCDGRDERYHLLGQFGRDLQVKVNAPDLIRLEFMPSPRKKPRVPGFVMLGGGVGDSYQPAEEQYCLARRALQVLLDVGRPVHVLTKSPLVERDFDLLTRINARHRAIVSMSFSSVDDALSARFEPHAPPPSQRLQVLCRAKQQGLATGMYLLPVIPRVSDDPAHIEAAVKAGALAGIDFIMCGGMTLKPGAQKEHFYRVAKGIDPGITDFCDIAYYDNPWGGPRSDYALSLWQIFLGAARRWSLPVCLPLQLVKGQVPQNDLVVLALRHIHYLYSQQGARSIYARAARTVAELPQQIDLLHTSLHSLRNAGPQVRRVIREVCEKGYSSLLLRLMQSSNASPKTCPS